MLNKIDDKTISEPSLTWDSSKNSLVTERVIPLSSNGQAHHIFGNRDENLTEIHKHFNVSIISKDGNIVVRGDENTVFQVTNVINHLKTLDEAGIELTLSAVLYAIKHCNQENTEGSLKLAQTVFVTARGKRIRPKTFGQLEYLEGIKKNDLTFAIGPAGTGKTYLAVVMAVAALKSKQFSKIVLARPAVEAGEKLGFLPGDLQEKVNPYLRPVYDSLDDILGTELASKYLEKGIVEVVPLAYMRGRTLEEAFIILDEAQNATKEQMKMFLTRLGMGSKAVITGDITQIDLPTGVKSGLRDAESILKGVEGIHFSYLTQVDVVRHPLVQKIIEAYDLQYKKEHGMLEDSRGNAENNIAENLNKENQTLNGKEEENIEIAKFNEK